MFYVIQRIAASYQTLGEIARIASNCQNYQEWKQRIFLRPKYETAKVLAFVFIRAIK